MPQDQNWIEAPAFGYSSQNSEINNSTVTIVGIDVQTIFSDKMKLVQDLIAQMISVFQTSSLNSF